MRVMCIVNEVWNAGIGPSYGDIDEVVDEMERWGEMFYELKRFADYMFWSAKFIPISDIDETELVTEEFNEKYLVPVK